MELRMETRHVMWLLYIAARRLLGCPMSQQFVHSSASLFNPL
jgi:hypothetical protein